MHNTHQSQTNIKTNPTATGCSNPDLFTTEVHVDGSVVHCGQIVTADQTFELAIEARILLAKVTVRESIGEINAEELRQMRAKAMCIAQTLGAISYRNGRDEMPTMIKDSEVLRNSWQSGYCNTDYHDNLDDENLEF
jgi:hypothetical protein